MFHKKFQIVVDRLIETGQVKNKCKLSADLGLYPAAITNLLLGKRRLDPELIQKLVDLYGVNPNFLYSVSKDVFLCQTTEN